MWWSITYQCSKCSHQWDDLVKREHKDELVDCPECKEEASCGKKITPPNHTRSSYVDGQRMKANQDGYGDLAKAAKLEVERAGIPHTERGGIDKEIKALKKSK